MPLDPLGVPERFSDFTVRPHLFANISVVCPKPGLGTPTTMVFSPWPHGSHHQKSGEKTIWWLVVHPITYKGFIHARWLFGISSINSIMEACFSNVVYFCEYVKSCEVQPQTTSNPTFSGLFQISPLQETAFAQQNSQWMPTTRNGTPKMSSTFHQIEWDLIPTDPVQ